MILYLDSSSLVKLYVEEEGASEVRSLVAQASWLATSYIAYPEARSALARRTREGSLTDAAHQEAKRGLLQEWGSMIRVPVTPALVREAGDVAESEKLRGADSIHLASFLDLVREFGEDEIRFSSFDGELNRAALRVARRIAKRR